MLKKIINTINFPRLSVEVADSLVKSQEELVWIKGNTEKDKRGKVIATYYGDTLLFLDEKSNKYSKYVPISNFIRASVYDAFILLEREKTSPERNI